ncbi:MAG: glutaminase domain-containing protein [Bacillota bacterium]
MQLMGDSLTVLGARLGIAWDPSHRAAYLVRHGRHPGIPLEIKAGFTAGGRTILFPLAPEGGTFYFLDQNMTVSSMTMGGIDPSTGLHLKLSVRIPLKPRDIKFSTIPALFFTLDVERLAASFRWMKQEEGPVSGEIFLEFAGPGYKFAGEGGGLSIEYVSPASYPGKGHENNNEKNIPCRDFLALLSGSLDGSRVRENFSLDKGAKGPTLAAAWCVYDSPVMNVLGDLCPFKYTEKFKGLKEVAAWAGNNYSKVSENGRKADAVIHGHNLGEAVNHLLAQTFHAWLMNTWFVKRPDGQDWFTVWEGSCYYHSTVDVEYTQGPFYLTFWPELLELELNEWPLFAKDGSAVLGDGGKGTLFLSHDMGSMCNCSGQHYPHEMEVEESANYILLAYAHWRRTGNDAVIRKQDGFIRKLLDFIVACDTTGNGIPDRGCANTIDDACPAIQFGREQIYLGVKAMAACLSGKIMLDHAGGQDSDKYSVFAGKTKRTIESSGWLGDHYAVTLSRSLDGVVNPWTGKPMRGKLEGWDAYHIYTANGLALLDMTGFNTGMSAENLKSDLITSATQTLGKYGCRHTSYVEGEKTGVGLVEGLAASAPRAGWVSMNMLRDIAAAYRGLDFMSMAERYWDWQSTTNTQQIALFFETFYGNNLHFYPRGVTVFGYLDAAAGFAYDAVESRKSFAPIRASLDVPLLLFADWEKGTAPRVKTGLEEGRIVYEVEGLRE